MELIKHATLDDYEEIKSIFNKHKEWFPHIRQDKLKSQIIEGGCIFDEGVVITYNLYKKNTAFGSVIAFKGDCILHQIVTAEQGNGCACKVFTKFVEYVDTNIFLTVRADNQIATGFYEKVGMNQVGHIAWKNGEIQGLVFGLAKNPLPL
jgi:hypothetical protein